MNAKYWALNFFGVLGICLIFTPIFWEFGTIGLIEILLSAIWGGAVGITAVVRREKK